MDCDSSNVTPVHQRRQQPKALNRRVDVVQGPRRFDGPAPVWARRLESQGRHGALPKIELGPSLSIPTRTRPDFDRSFEQFGQTKWGQNNARSTGGNSKKDESFDTEHWAWYRLRGFESTTVTRADGTPSYEVEAHAHDDTSSGVDPPGELDPGWVWMGRFVFRDAYGSPDRLALIHKTGWSSDPGSVFGVRYVSIYSSRSPSPPPPLLPPPSPPPPSPPPLPPTPPPPSMPPSELVAALKDFYTQTGGPRWRRSDRWLTGEPCVDRWYGVQCCPITHPYVTVPSDDDGGGGEGGGEGREGGGNYTTTAAIADYSPADHSCHMQPVPRRRSRSRLLAIEAGGQPFDPPAIFPAGCSSGLVTVDALGVQPFAACLALSPSLSPQSAWE